MKLSVWMITYNHEPFIAQAIESVLMQKTDFDYELVIGEDCSTDRTRAIVVDYGKRHPDKIRLLLPEKNLGAKQNWIQTLEACRGEYVAILEGDDYWTDPAKIQKQVDFLDSHPEYAICFHPARRVYESERREPEVIPPQTKATYSLSDLLEDDFIPTCSTVFRRGLFGQFPDWYVRLPIGDWPLHVLNAQYGSIGCINEVMGVYRVHSGGLWNTFSPADIMRTYVEFYEHVNAHLNFRYDRIINRSVSRKWDFIAGEVAKIGFRQDSAWEAQTLVRRILEQWPADLPTPKAWKSRVWAILFINLAFGAHKDDDFKAARSYLIRALWYDPYLLANLGVWSVGVESLLGQHVADWFRDRYRQAKGLPWFPGSV